METASVRSFASSCTTAGGGQLNAAVHRLALSPGLFQWPPTAVAEFFLEGRIPNGLQLGQVTLGCLAIGYSCEEEEYDHCSQIYDDCSIAIEDLEMVVTVKAGLAKIVEIIETGLRSEVPGLRACAQRFQDSLVGAKVALAWCSHIEARQVVYGVMLAVWCAKRAKFELVVRSNGGAEWTEVLAPDASCYEHIHELLSLLRGILIDVGFWHPRSKVSGLRSLATADEERMAAVNPQIRAANIEMLGSAFPHVQLMPGLPGSLVNVRRGTDFLYLDSAMLGKQPFRLSYNTHEFMSKKALCPDQQGTWWATANGQWSAVGVNHVDITRS